MKYDDITESMHETQTLAERYLVANSDLTTGDTVKDAVCEDDYSAGVRTWTFDDGSALVFEANDITTRKASIE